MDQTEHLPDPEREHKRKFWELGDGFEGSSSDWTEYVVWSIGVIGVFAYLTNPNMRRNMRAVEMDEPINDGPGAEKES